MDGGTAGWPCKPNGVVVGSLSVHEHWNNPHDPQYSRNLDPIHKGIELLAIHNIESKS